MKDPLGDRMKLYESTESSRKFIPLLPVLVRLDGKCFSKFTQKLERPYDQRLSNLMVDTTTYLVKESSAVCGYTQSDEITLAYYSDKIENQIFFNGKIQKIVSVLASTCSVYFNNWAQWYIPEQNKLAFFDCRAWQVPTLEEAANTFLWREFDATRNSVNMAAQELYSHKELMYKTTAEKQEMLFQKGVNWNDYPDFFKRGSYIQKYSTTQKLPAEELNKLPEKHQMRQNPELEFCRTEYRSVEMPPFNKVTNRVGVIFLGEEPKVT
jgi:tRNA(His) guanylyltransferase